MSEKKYWNTIYEKNEYERGTIPSSCSTFASSVMDALPQDAVIVELGCGNGRDSCHFAKSDKVKHVLAFDLADTAVKNFREETHKEKVHFFVQDFSCIPSSLVNGFVVNVVYSRFTLHSVTKNAASASLKWAYDHLSVGGLLLIEVRSVQDPMFGVGTKVDGERDAWQSSHFRRFVRIEELSTELVQLGFQLEYVLQSNNLSIFKDDNPVLIRIHARKEQPGKK